MHTQLISDQPTRRVTGYGVSSGPAFGGEQAWEPSGSALVGQHIFSLWPSWRHYGSRCHGRVEDFTSSISSVSSTKQERLLANTWNLPSFR